MIRTAEEILNENMPFRMLFKQVAITAINDARIEAIKECAKVATAIPLEVQDDFEMSVPQVYLTFVDKQSILKLIDQIK